MFRSSSRQSANTGMPPAARIACTVAANVSEGTTTSAPRTPTASRARCRAAVPELTATHWRARTKEATAFSKRATTGPMPSQPLRRTASTADTSRGPIDGRARGIRMSATSLTPRSTSASAVPARNRPAAPQAVTGKRRGQGDRTSRGTAIERCFEERTAALQRAAVGNSFRLASVESRTGRSGRTSLRASSSGSPGPRGSLTWPRATTERSTAIAISKPL